MTKRSEVVEVAHNLDAKRAVTATYAEACERLGGTAIELVSATDSVVTWRREWEEADDPPA